MSSGAKKYRFLVRMPCSPYNRNFSQCGHKYLWHETPASYIGIGRQLSLKI